MSYVWAFGLVALLILIYFIYKTHFAQFLLHKYKVKKAF